jgi:hypothetical protein
MIRTNPKYANICWTRVGSYRNNACVECKKKEECDSLYSDVTGRFSFEKSVSIPHARKRVAKIKIRNRLIPVAAWVLNSDKIKLHVDSLIDNGAVYSDDLIKASGLQREVLTTWLKHNGFEKRTKHSKRWENNVYAGL